MLVNAWNSRVKTVIGMASVALFAWIGCSPDPVGGDPDPVPPKGVLSREEFVTVLAEVQLVEGAAKLRTYRTDNEQQKLAEAYNDVWHRTGVDPSVFEKSYDWWWRHPEAMKGVWRDMLQLFKSMEVESNRADNKNNPGNLKNRTPGGTPAPSSK